MEQELKIKSFTQLNTWKKAHELVLKVYELTKSFPNDEVFGLSNQIRRAVVSITSNIAEGFSRHTYKEKVQFYSIALGSLTEVQNQLVIAKDLKYITKDQFLSIAELSITVNKLLNGLIKKSKSMTHDS